MIYLAASHMFSVLANDNLIVLVIDRQKMIDIPTRSHCKEPGGDTFVAVPSLAETQCSQQVCEV